MESPLVDDDICILKHETAYMAESPVAVCSGDESVASHFALVTAYEDIKKRLRDTEKENTLLRKRVKQLEDKVFRPEAPPSEGPQYMNKAFSAYRGIYMEKKDLQAELNKLKKERVESERLLTEQLQAKELELLQLKSEMETSQVMRSLNETQDYWQVERGSHELQLHTLQQQLERLKLENSQLQKVCGLKQVDSKSSVVNNDDNQEVAAESREVAVLRLYEGVCSEMLWLQALVKTQTDLMKKIRNKPLPLVLRRAASALPVQCRDDVEKNSSPVRVTAPRPPSAPPLPCASARSGPSTAPLLADGLQGNCWKEPWPLQRPPPLGSPAGPPNASQHGASLDDSSWSIPSHPRPSDAKFWESPKSSSSSTDWAKPY